MKIIDARNELCPKPLIMAKKALLEATPEEKFTLLINNETSKENVERFLKENNIFFQTTLVNDHSNDNLYEILISKCNHELINPNENEFCNLENKNYDNGQKKDISRESEKSNMMIVMNKDAIGHGPQELSDKLLQGFFTTIAEVPEKPYAIAFYNSGIYLCLNNSPVIDKIKLIEKAGTKILVCGTCVDFHKVKDQVGAGIISNMYDILGAMQNSAKVFTP